MFFSTDLFFRCYHKGMVYLLKEYGFCAGVKNSIETLKKAYEENSTASLLLPLMHNEIENEKLKSVYHFNSRKEDIKDDDAIVFPAHGHTKEEGDIFSSHNCYDAICPVLKSRYDVIEKNRNLVWYYFGKRNHQETKAFLSHFPFLNYIDPDRESYPAILNLPSALLVQSTMSEEKSTMFHDILSMEAELKIYLPPCSVYLNRKKEAISFLNAHDLKTFDILVLGSKTSSNCTEMTVSLKSLFPHCYVSQVNSISDIELSQLIKENVLLVSSTSISEESVLEIKHFLETKKRSD